MNRYKNTSYQEIDSTPAGWHLRRKIFDKTYFSFIAHFFISQDRNGGTLRQIGSAYCRFLKSLIHPLRKSHACARFSICHSTFNLGLTGHMVGTDTGVRNQFLDDISADSACCKDFDSAGAFLMKYFQHIPSVPCRKSLTSC